MSLEEQDGESERLRSLTDREKSCAVLLVAENLKTAYVH